MAHPLDLKDCSVTRSLELLGNRWTILILRETFFGVDSFDEMRANLGIASNILSERLKRLVDKQLLTRTPDPSDGRRFRYKLTTRGRDLYPITLAFMQWGDRWLSDDRPPPLTLRHSCGRKLRPVTCCSACGGVIKPRDVSF